MAEPRKSKRRSKRGRSLAQKIERMTDVRDAQPIRHIEHFIQNFDQGLELPKLDLISEEGAASAIELLDKQLELLHHRKETIRVLRKMTESS